jgi:zinc transport system substrate-binding protein
MKRCIPRLFGLTLTNTVLMTGVAQAEIRVVVTSKPVHSLVASVMGTVGAPPSLLVSGTASPHTYAMKPSDAKAVNAAQLFIRVSEDLEPFTTKLVKSLAPSVRIETLAHAPGLKHLERREGGAFDTHGGHNGHQSKSGRADQSETDPHMWLDPTNADLLALRIAAVLGEADPANLTQYAANAQALVARNAKLASELRQQLAPVAGRQFIVFHDAYQYFEAWSGLSAAGAVTTNPEVQPTGRRLAALRAKIRAANVACVFAEPQFQPKVIAAVTEGLPVRTGVLDPEGTLLEPGAGLYERLMRDLTAELVKCLAG